MYHMLLHLESINLNCCFVLRPSTTNGIQQCCVDLLLLGAFKLQGRIRLHNAFSSQVFSVKAVMCCVLTLSVGPAASPSRFGLMMSDLLVMLCSLSGPGLLALDVP